MPKISKMYLEVDPFKIIEKGFNKERSQVSESIFSLGNEYSGIRGFFDEEYSGDSLKGSYFNGIYEYALEDTPNAYKGIIKRTHFTINSVNWVKCKIQMDDEILDLNKVNFKDFYRELDMKSGLYTRTFTWITKKGNIKITFYRLMNMIHCHECIQKISFEADEDVDIKLTLSLDSNVLHWNSDCYYKKDQEFINQDIYGISVKTLTTKQNVVSAMKVDASAESYKFLDKEVEVYYLVNLKANIKQEITRYVVNLVDKNSDENSLKLIEEAKKKVNELFNKGFDNSLNENKKFFNDIWDASDIEINGDDKNQQGIRYCIFQLAQTYHGYSKDNNIGAKGLTGEAYSGHAFWDSETYCLPYYLLSNQEASKNLLMFRYNTLTDAKERAKQLDCVGACFPIATRNGKEGCNLWQHASLQFQPSTGVAYAIYHYMNLYNDEEFMQNYGLEMLFEISKFLLSRGQYNQNQTKFSFYGVMGPDEFQMMVNHNTYTNFMAKKTFDYFISLINSNKYNLDKLNINQEFILKIQDASEKMIILYDDITKLYEQHDGFFDLPHIDINKIPEEDFPLYSHWTYDRIYRNDMIKQPDVLMFMFLYSQDFTFEQKKANYEYYEPRCIHESSLSPSIHSIFACELNKLKEAKKFFEFATRLDLDDYNCNTKEGIHTTSIAAAWMNIVYGFGGLRSDKDVLSINPIIIEEWNSYSFKIKYKNTKIKVEVTKKKLIITVDKTIKLRIFNKDYIINDKLEVQH